MRGRGASGDFVMTVHLAISFVMIVFVKSFRVMDEADF